MAKSPSAVLRLQSDLRQISTDPPQGCSASPASDSNIFVWRASIFGPPDSAWVRLRDQTKGNATVVVDSHRLSGPPPPLPQVPAHLSALLHSRGLRYAAPAQAARSCTAASQYRTVCDPGSHTHWKQYDFIFALRAECALRAGRRDLLIEIDLLRGERCRQEHAVVLDKLPDALSAVTTRSRISDDVRDCRRTTQLQPRGLGSRPRCSTRT